METKRIINLPPVTGRLELTSLEDYVDQQLERMGSGKIDLTDPTMRGHFRAWLHGVLSGYLLNLEGDLAKGAERGIRQVLIAARDPDYYKKAKHRRQQQRATMERHTAEARASTAQWIAEREAAAVTAQTAIEEGRLKLFPGTHLDARLLPDDLKGPKHDPPAG